MLRRFLPALYAIEFLLTLLAVYTVWGEVGGLDSLDYMPWYWKAGVGFGAALATVQLTAAVASALRWRAVLWGGILAALAVAAGLSSYYYYLNAPRDDQQDDAAPTPTAVLAVPRRG